MCIYTCYVHATDWSLQGLLSWTILGLNGQMWAIVSRYWLPLQRANIRYALLWIVVLAEVNRRAGWGARRVDGNVHAPIGFIGWREHLEIFWSVVVEGLRDANLRDIMILTARTKALRRQLWRLLFNRNLNILREIRNIRVLCLFWLLVLIAWQFFVSATSLTWPESLATHDENGIRLIHYNLLGLLYVNLQSIERLVALFVGWNVLRCIIFFLLRERHIWFHEWNVSFIICLVDLDFSSVFNWV